MRKRIISILLCMVLVLGMVPASVLALESDGKQTTLDVSKGNIVIGDGTLDAYGADGTHLTDADPDGYEITGTTTSYSVSVIGGTHNISINWLSIDVAYAAFSITDAHVNLAFTNDNTLDSGNGYKDLHLGSADSSVTINGRGTLYAGFLGGNNGGTITIESGGYSFDLVTTGGKGTIAIKGGTYEYGNADSNCVGLQGVPVAEHYKVVYVPNRGWPYDVVFAGYSIRFDANGGSGQMADMTEISGNFAPPACTFTAPADKVFLGWALSANSTEVIHGTIDVVDDMTLYAVWGKESDAGLVINDAFNFPDAAFRTYISENLDLNHNGYLSNTEINDATYLRPYGLSIHSLEGIEYFTALTYLECDHNQLTTLDVSKNTNLEVLNCGNNQLTQLDLSKNPALYGLYCHNNKLTTLDVSNHTELRTLDCENNGLQVLNVSGCPDLIDLDCRNNELTSLDVSNTGLDSTVNYVYLEYAGNHYKIAPDANNQFDLSTLPGNFDPAKVIDITGGSISGNKLTVDANTYLVVYLYDCGNSQTVSFSLMVDVPELVDVALNETNFPDPVFRAYVTTNFDADQNGTLTVAELNAVTKIDVGNWDNETKIADLKGIEYFRNLTELHCDNNNLNSLDVSQLAFLTTLDCHGNHVAELDISKNLGLTYLYVGGSSENISDMSSLDLRKNIALETVYVTHTKLTELDLSHNTKISMFGCQYSQVTSMDLSKSTSATIIRFYGEGNAYAISVAPDNTFDLTTLPGNFDVSKASGWIGGTVSGNVLTVDEGATEVTYTYDCGKNKTATFTLNVTQQTTYTVTLNANGGTGEIVVKTDIAGNYHLPDCPFTAPAGKQFKGWATSADGDVIMAEGINVTANITLYAIWENTHTHGNGIQTILDISKGDIRIYDDSVSGYDPNGNHITTPDPDGYILTGYSDSDSKKVGIWGTHKITLRDLTIDVSGVNWAAAFAVGGTVQITLEGENILRGGIERAGLNIYETGAVTITAASTGTLIASSAYSSSYAAAAIGANYNGTSGILIIQGGCVSATSGGPGADAIGAGKGGSRGTVTITGGSFASGDAEETSVYGIAVAEGFRVANLGTGDYPYKVEPLTNFLDVSVNNRFVEAINYVSDRGIMNGRADGTFAPNESMNRQMVAMVLWNMAGKPEVSAASPFSDVTGGRFYSAIVWAYSCGIISGYQDGTFRPTEPISRQHFSVMLYRYASYMGYGISAANETQLSDFPDYTEINLRRFETACQWMVSRGFISGKSNGCFDPLGTTTRAQMAMILSRFLKAVNQ